MRVVAIGPKTWVVARAITEWRVDGNTLEITFAKGGVETSTLYTYDSEEDALMAANYLKSEIEAMVS